MGVLLGSFSISPTGNATLAGEPGKKLRTTEVLRYQHPTEMMGFMSPNVPVCWFLLGKRKILGRKVKPGNKGAVLLKDSSDSCYRSPGALRRREAWGLAQGPA